MHPQSDFLQPWKKRRFLRFNFKKCLYDDWSFFKVIKLILWALGLATLSYLVYKEFFPIVDEYKHHNVGTYVGVIHEVQPGEISHTLPPVILCMPRSFVLISNIVKQMGKLSASRDPFCDSDEGINSHLLNVFKNVSLTNIACATKQDHLNFYYNNLFVPLITNLIFNDSKDFESLKFRNFDWNQLVIHAVWDMFSCIFMFDRQYNFSETPAASWCAKQAGLVNYLVSNKPILDRLFARFVDIVCDHVYYRDPVEDTLKPTGVCLKSLQRDHSAFTNNKFCFTLPVTGSRLSAFVDAVGSNGHWAALNGSLYYLSEFRPSFEVFISPGDIFSRRYLKLYDSIYASSDMAETVNIQFTLPFTVLEERDDRSCFKHASKSHCKNHCMLKKLVLRCNCVPFSMRTMVDSNNTDLMPYCNVGDYTKCKFNVKVESGGCDEQCSIPCQYMGYQWTPTKNKIFLNPERRLFALTVKRAGSVHVQFHTTTKTSRAVLLSQLVAIINFYFGFSGLTIVTTLVYCFTLFKRCRAERESTKKHKEMQFENKSVIIEMEQEKAKGQIVEEKRFNDFITAQGMTNENLHRTLLVLKSQLKNLELCTHYEAYEHCHL